MIRTILFSLFLFARVLAFSQDGLEPCTYSNNFESGRLGAWASYPLWQDNAYDQNFRINKIIGDEANLSIVQRVTPYSMVDQYAGAQKLLDMYLVPGSKITLRYYLKSNSAAEFFKVRLAAGAYGKLDVTLPHPETNKWSWISVGFDDFVRENPAIAGKDKIRIYALAFLTKLPKGDPDMPLYLALDDISFKGAHSTDFHFDFPAMDQLPEFREYIPKQAYHVNDLFSLKGHWLADAQRVSLKIVSLTDTGKSFYLGKLSKRKEGWETKPLKLHFPEGIYLGKLVAYKGSSILSETSFTIHIAPLFSAGQHPRLLFDEEKKNGIEKKLREEHFQNVYANILRDAKSEREKFPVTRLVYRLDQFPDENWLPSWVSFGDHIYGTGPALKWNAFAYSFSGDTAAGNYAKNVLVKLSQWPDWVSPWMKKRGRYSDHRMGTWSNDVALAYDLTYRLMTPTEAAAVRKAIMKNIVEGAHYTYVYDNEVTSNTSNWIAHIIGGSLMNMAAIAGDGPETENLEPYFTGAVLKFYGLLTHVTDTVAGSWGEGYGYNNYTFSNLAYSIPTLDNVYHIDLSAPLKNTYNEYIWGGLIKDRKWFGFGDSGDSLESSDNWAFLLSKYKKPRLSWFYHYLKSGETLDDVLFDTQDIPQENPFKENPVKVFRKIGTTVLKSGWEKNDFVFVMRTGAFFNHQHLDQGSFWLADRGITFIEDQSIHHSDYYNDPLYQSSFIQPVAHSTILINGNEQSQRIGDPLNFAPGFDDHARIGQFLDGDNAAFSSGDIGRLYWGAVDSLTRNILFIKPRTLLMLDLAVPKNKDVELSLLYHTKYLKDIDPGQSVSRITKEGIALNLIHLSPDSIKMEAVETPHYINTLLKDTALEKEGMLRETVRTNGDPLVIANLLTTTDAGTEPEVVTKKGDGFVSGVTSGKSFAFSSKPGNRYTIDGIETNALAMTWDGRSSFVALATIFRKNGVTVMESDAPMTFELKGQEIRYDRSAAGEIKIYAASKPASVLLNGVSMRDFSYDGSQRMITLRLPEGEGRLQIK
jgi:hypothetical protein